jgi:hypothetical protein
MAKDRGSNAQEQLDQMAHAVGFGSAWFSEIAEQNLKQGIGALDGTLRTVRKAADAFGHQASSVREHSAALLEKSMGNAAELGNRLARSKDPLQWAEAQSEFLSKQAQAMANGAQSLGEALINGSNEVASAGLHQVREVSRKRTGRTRG